MDEAEKQAKTDRIAPWQYKAGQSGNPAGRPKGSRSLKEYAKDLLSSMTDAEREEYLQGLDKRTIWEMAEGKAKQESEHSFDEDTKLNVVIRKWD